jgi:transportin-1
VQKLLQELVPVLITNMIYADADYMILEPSQVENDNANVPDSLDSIKPRFHKESDNVDGDEDDSGKVDRSSHGWGAEWTARKAAAGSLDELSSVFPEVVQFVLPQIEQKLNHASWEHQEAGVLALGAIGVHCQDKLAAFLPAVLGLLLKLCEATTPLLRSIACWCVSRFGAWIFNAQNPNRQEVISSVLKVLLPRCLDRNKRVQEATISAILTLAHFGQAQIVPYLNDIVDTLVKALPLYQLINQRILFDTISAVAWAAGPEFDKPQIMQGLVGPVFQKFNAVPDNDVLALPLCECVAGLSQVLGKSIASALPQVVMRGIKTINDTAMASQMWEQNPNEYERPQHEMMASCCDLFAAILVGLREHGKDLAKQLSMLSVVPLAIRTNSSRVKQSGFWLLAMGGASCIEVLIPLIPEMMPLCTAGLGPTISMTVSMNSCRAIGEMANNAPPETLTPHLQAMVPALLAILQRGDIKPYQMRGHNELLRGVCETLNRLRQRSALGQQWAAVLGQLPADRRAQFQQRYGLSA